MLYYIPHKSRYLFGQGGIAAVILKRSVEINNESSAFSLVFSLNSLGFTWILLLADTEVSDLLLTQAE